MTRDRQDTLRPEELRDAEAREAERDAEQRELTANLLQDPDPQTRLIAHVSDRQLAMFQMLLDLRDRVDTLSDEVHQILKKRSLTPATGISLAPHPPKAE
jgi:hypothetical protein